MKKPKFVVVDVTYLNAHVNPANDCNASEAYEQEEHNFGNVMAVLTPENAKKLGEALLVVAAGGKVKCESDNGYACSVEPYNADEIDEEDMEDEDDEFKNFSKE